MHDMLRWFGIGWTVYTGGFTDKESAGYTGLRRKSPRMRGLEARPRDESTCHLTLTVLSIRCELTWADWAHLKSCKLAVGPRAVAQQPDAD